MIRHTRARRALPLAAAATAVTFLTGCGVSGDDAAQAWERGRTELAEVESLRIITEPRSTPSAQGIVVPDAIELSGPTDGSSLAVTSTVKDDGVTTRDEIRVVDDTQYRRRTVENDALGGQEHPIFAEHWRSQPNSGNTRGMDMGVALSSVLDSLPPKGALKDVPVKADGIRRSGQDAIRYALEEPVKDLRGVSTLTAFTVAKSDGRRPPSSPPSAGGLRTVVTFADVNEVPPIEAPPTEDRAEDR